MYKHTFVTFKDDQSPDIQYLPQNIHTVLLCLNLLWLTGYMKIWGPEAAI